MIDNSIKTENFVSIAILTYNAEDVIFNTIESILKNDPVPDEIILVDNFSKDKTIEIVKKSFPQVKVIENKENLGVTKGFNLAINKSKGNIVGIITQDVIIEKDVIKKCVELLKDPTTAVSCPKVNFFGTNKIWFGGTKILSGFKLLKEPTMRITRDFSKYNESNKFDSIIETDYSAGCTFFLKKEIFNQVNGFDTQYVNYFVDPDFCIKLKKIGMKVMMRGDAIAYHKSELDANKPTSFKNAIKKYKTYIAGEITFVNRHFSLRDKIIWYVKLPITVPITVLGITFLRHIFRVNVLD